MWVISIRPMKYRNLIWIAVILFSVNSVLRVIYNEVFVGVLHSTFFRSMLCVFFMVVCSIGLIVFKPKRVKSDSVR
jgi:hypothetical protein